MDRTALVAALVLGSIGMTALSVDVNSSAYFFFTAPIGVGGVGIGLWIGLIALAKWLGKCLNIRVAVSPFILLFGALTAIGSLVITIFLGGTHPLALPVMLFGLSTFFGAPIIVAFSTGAEEREQRRWEGHNTPAGVSSN